MSEGDANWKANQEFLAAKLREARIFGQSEILIIDASEYEKLKAENLQLKELMALKGDSIVSRMFELFETRRDSDEKLKAERDALSTQADKLEMTLILVNSFLADGRYRDIENEVDYSIETYRKFKERGE